MYQKNLALIISGVLLLSSCSASRFGWKPENKLPENGGTSHQIEDFDPLLLDDDDIVIQKNKENDVNIGIDNFLEKTEPIAEKGKVQTALVSGFRVNLMSGKNEAAINEEKKKAMFKFQYDVYVVFESPYYKIRLGDFLSYEEAALVQEQVRRRGFVDAFIAKCLVDRVKAENNRKF